jgi:membrane fusion protein (multidrug efflux system)
VYVVKAPEGGGAVPVQPAPDAVFAVERRFVKPGQVHEDRVAIVSGLQPGEQVVTTGQIKLNNGSRVKIDNSQELKPPAERPMQ